jgi:mitochondrial fission protein ELM1
MMNSSLLSKKTQSASKSNLNINCWVLTEGMIGTQNQCVGVAEALGLTPIIRKIGLRQPWKKLTPWLGFETPYSFIPALTPPWPDLLIASGRKSIAASRYIKKQSGGKTFTVQIQDPKTNPNQFDLVAVPYHDTLRGDNVIVTDGAPNKITLSNLKDAKKEFAPLFKSMTSPRVAVLIGGNSRTHKLTKHIVENFCRQLSTLEAGLMITTSRRSGEENLTLIEQELTSPDNFIWDGTGDNPYLGMLAWADYIIVTSDSVSMLSDAGTTGKPVYVINLDGGSPRFERLHNHFQSKGISRLFDGNLESWSYEPLHDAQKIADAISQKMG